MSKNQGDYVRCRVNVIGAGISGLTTAIALRKAGHEVHIYESLSVRSQANEMVHICPNANSVLHQLGVNHESGGGRHLEFVHFRTVQGRLLERSDINSESHCWQQPWLITRRVDLLEHLDGTACSETLLSVPTKVHRGCIAIAVDSERCIIYFDNGQTVHSDIIIGADGMHSTAWTSISKKPPNDEAAQVVFQPTLLILPLMDSKSRQGYPQTPVEQCNEVDITAYPSADADILTTYAHKRLAVAGEAAHPFAPDSIHGASMAIEDGASLGVLLSGMQSQEDIPERLQLYSEIRQKRITEIQELSWEAWRQLDQGNLYKEHIHSAFSHDEIHHSTHVLRQHIWAKASRLIWRQPVGFGPMTSPRQSVGSWRCSNPRSDRLAAATSLTACIRFRTSATLLRNIFPSDAYSFAKHGTVAEASFVFQAIENLPWLGGRGYNLLLFQIHGIRHRSTSGAKMREGSYVAVVLEDLTDPIISGREDLGWPKLYSAIDVRDGIKSGGGLSVSLSWGGTEWMSLAWNDLQWYREPDKPPHPSVEHLFVHKYIPATTETPGRQTADADYDVLMPPPSTASAPVKWQHVSNSSNFGILSRSEQELPTLWHVASRLAELPILGIVDAKVGMKQGQDDFTGAIRV